MAIGPRFLRWMFTDVAVVVGGVRMEREDVLVVTNLAGERLPTADPSGSVVIEKFLRANNCVIVAKKDFSKLIVYFGSPWTENAQYKISQAKQRHVLILVYRGDKMSALKHVNALLGGEVSFFSDDFERFTGSKVCVATDGKQITNHSRRCFVVGLDTVDRFIN
ncbi:hypothetical protein PAHAL_5G443200 [Panicum hallii]|uniref:Uncharacterized protein n=1 Tax=Panicum hallii TaxID=206008 RepID=A0A2T8IN73_9POAL|nr:uncharacterized protein LOC112895175 [Panicum hallii]PVH39132.1 hypothetical protein PAHAL_5G443200 [Panicum hallii]